MTGQQPRDWIAQWQRVARRIRVPLGFLVAALYLFELLRRAPRPAAVGLSLAFVIPGLWLRGWAAGTVKKNRKLAVTGPYAYTRNPLYLGSMLIAAGFTVALMSWLVAAALALMFVAIYVPVIASEERYLRANFQDFDEYRRRVPRLLPRLRPVRSTQNDAPDDAGNGFSLALYRKHREYNALLGALLLYLCLLFLRPGADALLNAVR